MKGFGCRPITTVPRARGPASESLQGRNPREVCSEGAAGLWGFGRGGSGGGDGIEVWALLMVAVGERI